MGSSADPPPESRKSTRSFWSSFAARSISSWVARQPFSSGVGCPASNKRIFCRGARWSYLTMTSPPLIRSPSTSSTACAIAAEALPAPMAHIPLNASRSSTRSPHRRLFPSTARTRLTASPGSTARNPALKICRASALRSLCMASSQPR